MFRLKVNSSKRELPISALWQSKIYCSRHTVLNNDPHHVGGWVLPKQTSSKWSIRHSAHANSGVQKWCLYVRTRSDNVRTVTSFPNAKASSIRAKLTGPVRHYWLAAGYSGAKGNYRWLFIGFTAWLEANALSGQDGSPALSVLYDGQTVFSKLWATGCTLSVTFEELHLLKKWTKCYN